MGDPRRLKKKYDKPLAPWDAKRIAEEKILVEDYGLKKKMEIWRASTFLRKIKQQAKKLIAATSEQAKKEEKLLINRLINLSLVGKDAKIDDILGLDVKKILDRRLQSIVFKKGLSRRIKQARQFITHKHIMVGDKIINKPSYLVRKEEENKVGFNPLCSLGKADHPERNIVKKEKSREVKPLKKPVERVERPKRVKE